MLLLLIFIFILPRLRDVPLGSAKFCSEYLQQHKRSQSDLSREWMPVEVYGRRGRGHEALILGSISQSLWRSLLCPNVK